MAGLVLLVLLLLVWAVWNAEHPLSLVAGRLQVLLLLVWAVWHAEQPLSLVAGRLLVLLLLRVMLLTEVVVVVVVAHGVCCEVVCSVQFLNWIINCQFVSDALDLI